MAQRRAMVIIGGRSSELVLGDDLLMFNGAAIAADGGAKLVTGPGGGTWYAAPGSSGAVLFGIQDFAGNTPWQWLSNTTLWFSGPLTGTARTIASLTNTDTSTGSLISFAIASGSSGGCTITYHAPEYMAVPALTGATRLEGSGSGGVIFSDANGTTGFKWVLAGAWTSPLMTLDASRTLTVNQPGTSSSGSMVQTGSPGGFPGMVGYFGSTSRNDIRFGNGNVQIGTSGSSGTGSPTRFLNVSTGAAYPSSDNLMSSGGGNNRWTVVYAATGSINTSDARLKTDIAPLSDAELAAAKDMSREVGTFQFLDAIAEKGAAEARRHVGMTVQRAIEIMQGHGLDPFAYGFICYDTWEEQPAITDEATGDFVQEYRAAGDIYSFRTDELLLFMARGFDTRLSALEGAT